jgi:pyrimidine operon attenuation protein/uracil phosphoribosyltransferase
MPHVQYHAAQLHPDRVPETPSMSKVATHRRPLTDKQAAAAQLTELLPVPDPARVTGRRVLIDDDVLTSGETLNAIAGLSGTAERLRSVGWSWLGRRGEADPECRQARPLRK